MTLTHAKLQTRFSHGQLRLRILAAILLLCGAPMITGAPSELPPLTTARGQPRLPGKFVWADLVTDDVLTARKFYSALFGWTFRDTGGYAVGANDERPLCGMFQRPRPVDRPEAKPRWFAYISVSSVAKAQRAVIKSGGRVLAAPKDMPKRGEQAVFADPEGALFGVIKSSSGDPEDFLPEPGDWIWIQLFSRDARKAAEFYRTIAGYEIVENDTSPRPNDYVLVAAGYARATALTLPEHKPRVHPGWMPFVRVTNVSDCVTRAGALGGKVLLNPNAQLLDGKVAIIADPTGAEIGVMEWSNETLKK